MEKSQHLKNKRQSQNYEIIEEEKIQLVYDPAHPYADSDGYIRKPDINVVEEMVDLMSLSRTYEANVQTFNATKDLAKKALEI